ncbi:unnamed protein product [Caretta caretta]
MLDLGLEFLLVQLAFFWRERERNHFSFSAARVGMLRTAVARNPPASTSPSSKQCHKNIKMAILGQIKGPSSPVSCLQTVANARCPRGSEPNRFLELPKYIDEIKMEICSWLVKRQGGISYGVLTVEKHKLTAVTVRKIIFILRGGVQITLEHAVTNHIFFWCLGWITCLGSKASEVITKKPGQPEMRRCLFMSSTSLVNTQHGLKILSHKEMSKLLVDFTTLDRPDFIMTKELFETQYHDTNLFDSCHLEVDLQVAQLLNEG